MLHEFWQWLTHTGPTLKEAYGNESLTVSLRVYGSSMIAFAFIVMGLLCVVFAKKTEPPPHKSRIRLAYLFGACFFLCGTARAINVVCFYKGYHNLNGVAEVMTGIVSIITVLYIPFVIRIAIRSASINEVHEELVEVKGKLDAIKNLNDEIKP